MIGRLIPDSNSSYSTGHSVGLRLTYKAKEGHRKAINLKIEKLFQDFGPSKRNCNYISSILLNSGDSFFLLDLVQKTETAFRIFRKVDNPPVCGNPNDTSYLNVYQLLELISYTTFDGK